MSSKSRPKWREDLEELGRRSQAAAVLLVTQRLDDGLEKRLTARMPKLSNTMRDRLFAGYGPFASFSVKIDIAYAMGLMSKEAHHDFHAIRDIRNKFAHPKDRVHFDSDPVSSLVARLHGYKKKDHSKDHMGFFFSKINDCWKAITPKEAVLTSFLIHGGDLEGDDTSPEKS